MSRISCEDRQKILETLQRDEVSISEVAKQYHVTEAFCKDTREQLRLCIQAEFLDPKDISLKAFDQAMVHVEELAQDLLKAGMSGQQVHEICKISYGRIKMLKKAIPNSARGKAQLVSLFKYGLEGQIKGSVFSINYKASVSEKRCLNDVLIALHVTQRQVAGLFPNPQNCFGLKEAFDLASETEAGESEIPVKQHFVLDTCEKCGIPFLRHLAKNHEKTKCPFCEYERQLQKISHEKEKGQVGHVVGYADESKEGQDTLSFQEEKIAFSEEKSNSQKKNS